MTDTLPKTKPKRRWLQFSMRTVLVIVTLLCVALGLWIAPLNGGGGPLPLLRS